MPRRFTVKQKRFLFSKGSPLIPKQKKKFASEIHSGKAKLRRKRKRS